jgi:hypothetical protein
LGGSCKKGYFLDTGGYFDDEEEEESEVEESDDETYTIRISAKEQARCDAEANNYDSEEEDSDDDVPVAQLIQRKVADNKKNKDKIWNSEDGCYETPNSSNNYGTDFMSCEPNNITSNCSIEFLKKHKKYYLDHVKAITAEIKKKQRNPKKRAEEKVVPLRPTYNLAEKKPTKQFKNNSQKYTLFRHNKPVKGWCKYALYNSKNNNYMECNFDGEKVTDWANGKIHKTLNAWTTSNLLEQCARENKPRKTVKNNAYKETNFIYMNLDEKKMIYTSAEKPTKLNPIMWLKSIILIDKESELAVDWTYEKVGKKTKAKMVYVENK